MTEDEQTILMIRGMISTLSKEQQDKVATCSAILNGLVEDYAEFAILAISLIGAELSVKNS